MYDQISIENGRLAEPGLDDPGGPMDKPVRIFSADLNGRTGLKQAHVFDDIEQKIGDIVHPVGAVRFHTAKVDLCKIGVGAAFSRRHAYFWRCRLVVELDPEAMQQLFGSLAGQGAVFDAPLVKWIQMLVETPRIEGIPGIELGGHPQMNEPVIL